MNFNIYDTSKHTVLLNGDYLTFQLEPIDLNTVEIRQLLVCNIPNFARLFVMTSASICACNPTKLRA